MSILAHRSATNVRGMTSSLVDYDNSWEFYIRLNDRIAPADHVSVINDYHKPVKPEGPPPHMRAWLFVSALGPFYTYILDDNAFRESRKPITFPYGELAGFESVARSINEFMESRGYRLLTDGILRRRVTGVALDLSEPDDVTVLKCLFFDYDSWNEPDAPFYEPL